MAKYTIEIRSLIERGFHFALDDYPIFDECHRKELNEKIIEHYYFREIGAETPDRFNFYLRRKMREIMPYYNQLYISEMIKFDPLATDYFEEQREHERAMAEQNGKQSAEARNADSKNVYSDTGHAEGNNLVTNNLKDVTDTKGTKDANTDRAIHSVEDQDYSEHENTTNSQTTVFCDDPQTQLGNTINQDGNIVNAKYATTETFVNGKGTRDTTGQKDTTTDTSDKTTYDEDTTGNSVTTRTGTVNTDTKSDSKTDGESRVTADSNISALELGNKQQTEQNKESAETKGRRGFNPSELLVKYRKTFLNIDMMIVEELNTLFMGVY